MKTSSGDFRLVLEKSNVFTAKKDIYYCNKNVMQK